MWSDNKADLKAIMWSRFLHLDALSKRTTPHPSDIQEMLDALCIPITETTMDERVKSLLGK